MKTYRSCSSAETKDFGKFLAERVRGHGSRQERGSPRAARVKPKNAFVLALSGDLGSGKTTFVQGFLRALGVRKKITSPTFVLVKRYALRKKQFMVHGSWFTNCYHVDAYRLKSPRDLEILGFEEIVSDSRNIVLIEWAEKIKKLLPKDALWVKFFHGKKEDERIFLSKLSKKPRSYKRG